MVSFLKSINCQPFIFTLLLLLSQTASATYRCTTSEGKTIYQETPCAIGNQAEVDNDITRARKQNTRLKEESDKRYLLGKSQEETNRKERVGGLKACLDANARCTTLRFDISLTGNQLKGEKGLKKNDVTAALGTPENVQTMGGKDLWYYSIPVSLDGDDRSRGKRIQIIFDLSGVSQVNFY